MKTQKSPDKIRKKHILNAAKKYKEDGNPSGFNNSTTYDVIINNKPYPPKVICSRAYEEATGQPLESNEFFGARDGKWLRMLESFGFKIFEKHTRDHEKRASNKPEKLQLLTDIKEIEEDKTLDHSMRKRLIDARVGQGKFRKKVLENWDGCCAVTGCNIPELLRASHVQPWAYKPDRKSRLDASNGLPLASMLDALFDSGLMTFDECGQAHFSDENQEEQLRDCGLIPEKEKMRLRRAPNDKEKHYLRIHHSVVFKGTLPNGASKSPQ